MMCLTQNINKKLPLMTIERKHKVVKQFRNIGVKSEQLLLAKKVMTNIYFGDNHQYIISRALKKL